MPKVSAKYYPVPQLVQLWQGFLWLIDIESVQFSVLGLVSNSSTESLILAQDERWRRA